MIFGFLPQGHGGDLFHELSRMPLPVVGVGVGHELGFLWRHRLWGTPFWRPGNLVAVIPAALAIWMVVVLGRVWVATRSGGRGT